MKTHEPFKNLGSVLRNLVSTFQEPYPQQTISDGWGFRVAEKADGAEASFEPRRHNGRDLRVGFERMEELGGLVALHEGLGGEKDRLGRRRVEKPEGLGALDGAVGELDGGGERFEGLRSDKDKGGADERQSQRGGNRRKV